MVAIVVSFCACGLTQTSENVDDMDSNSEFQTSDNMFEDGDKPDYDSDLVIPDEAFGDIDDEKFIPDYLPGEENKIGNIYTNRTLCRQGNYIYHYNDAEKCLQKWKSDEGIDSLETICYIESGMLDAVSPDYNGFALNNHLEVVGDYIYLCIQTGEVIAGRNLRSIIQIRTDGEEQMTLASDCNNCQFRIVDNILFYLSVSCTQYDLNTTDCHTTVKIIDLAKSGLVNPQIDVESSVLIDITSGADNNEPHVDNLFVIPTEEKYVIGYYYDSYYVRHDITWEGDTLAEADTVDEEDFRYFSYSYDTTVLYPNLNGQILIAAGQWNWMPYQGGVRAFDFDLWPDELENGAELIPLDTRPRITLKCVADNMLFLSTEERVDGAGIYSYCIKTNESQKINNDVAEQIEYVGDGKIYYYVRGYDREDNGVHIFCCCDLDGENWEKISTY